MQTVQITPSFLGAVTSLSWVCTLPMMSSKPDVASSNSSVPIAPNSDDIALNLLSQQKYEDWFDLAVSISQLPLNLSLSKPESLSTPATEKSFAAHQTSFDKGGSGGNDAPKLTAAKKKMEWGPLITHCYSCYWKCVLFSLKHLHSYSNDLVGGEKIGTDAQFRTSYGYDGKDRSFYPSTSNTSPDQLSAVEQSGTVATSSSTVPIGSNDMNVVIEVCLSRLDLLDSEVPTIVDCMALLLPKVHTHTHGLIRQFFLYEIALFVIQLARMIYQH